MKTLIKGGRVVDPANGLDGIYDVLIEDGKIAKTGSGLKDQADTVIDASGKLVLPGNTGTASKNSRNCRPSRPSVPVAPETGP